MKFVIEYIDGSGVQHTELTEHRWSVPEPGDVIDFTLMNGEYPFNHSQFGTVERIGECAYCKADEAYICSHPGSIYWSTLDGKPFVSISGGPFARVKRARLVPTYEMRIQRFWNWGRNSPGAHQGIDYHVMRPVFQLNPLCQNS